MYNMKSPTGLKQRIAYLGGFERALRLSLLRDGYQYVTRNVCSVFYLVCFKSQPRYSNGIFLKTQEADESVRLNGGGFQFLQEGHCLDLKTMEVIHNVRV